MCLGGGKRKPKETEIRACWLLMDKDEVELFNLQIALILCIYCVVVELLTGSSLVPVNFSTV